MLRKSIVAASMLAISGVSANAATATGSLSVSVTIAATCAVSNVVNVAFGSQTTLTSAVNAAGSFDVNCSNGVAYNTVIGASANANGTQRRMVGAVSTSSYINYNLYSDAGRTIAFPTSGAGISGSGTGAVQTVNIYGQIPVVAVTPPNDSYSDSVTITVNY